jgi:hypothetical protein
MDSVESDASNNTSIVDVFVATITFLPSHLLATIRGVLHSHFLQKYEATHTDTVTDGKDFSSTPLRWAQMG